MNTGGPAFPQHGWSKDLEVLRRMKDQGGMTLLDWYAGQALAGLMASQIGGGPDDSYANSSYDLASAMLAEKARREATGKDSLQVPDHSPDAGKMAELEAANTMLKREIERLRTELCETVDLLPKLKIANGELVEAFEGCLENLERWCRVKHREARAILAKHKGAA